MGRRCRQKGEVSGNKDSAHRSAAEQGVGELGGLGRRRDAEVDERMVSASGVVETLRRRGLVACAAKLILPRNVADCGREGVHLEYERVDI